MVFRKNNRKGQAAIEFLMTYGWMLLVVLIVGALIFSFVDFGSLLPNKLDLSNAFKGDAQRLVASATSNNVQFVTRYVGARVAQVNATVSTITLSPIGGKSCTFTSVTDASGGTQTPPAIVSFVNGQEGVFSFDCSANGGLIEGDVVEGTVTIQYADPRTPSLTLTSTGPIRVPITN